MEYSLVFTIYGLIFTAMLLITLIMKKRKKTIRTKLYTMLVASAMIMALSEITTIMVFLKITQNEVIFMINWKIRMTTIFAYVGLMICYYDVLMNGTKYKTLTETIFKNKKNLFTVILFTIISVLYVIFGNYTIKTASEIVYLKGIIGYTVLAMSFITAIYIMSIAIKVKNERKNIFICFLIIFILLLTAVPLQVLIPKISFMPFLIMFLLYVIYHNVENPDIELLEELEFNIRHNKVRIIEIDDSNE